MGYTQVLIALALIVVSAVLTALTAKKPARPIDAAPAVLGDFNIPQIAEGTPQAVLFGDCWLESWQVLWYGNLRSEAITTDTSGGGKK